MMHFGNGDKPNGYREATATVFYLYGIRGL